MLLYISIKNYKNIACTDFMNVIKDLNLYSYEENQSFLLELITRMYEICNKDVLCSSLNHKIQAIYDHISVVLAPHIIGHII